MTWEQYRSYPETLTMRQVSVDVRDTNNRADRFKLVTTILDASIGGGQIGELYEKRWSGEVDIRSIKSTMKMDVLRRKTPEMVEKAIWDVLAYNVLRTVMAVAANENDIEPREISFKGAKQALTAFGPKLEAAQPGGAAGLFLWLWACRTARRCGTGDTALTGKVQAQRTPSAGRATNSEGCDRIKDGVAVNRWHLATAAHWAAACLRRLAQRFRPIAKPLS